MNNMDPRVSLTISAFLMLALLAFGWSDLGAWLK